MRNPLMLFFEKQGNVWFFLLIIVKPRDYFTPDADTCLA